MKYIKLFPFIVLFTVLIASCSKKSNLGKMVPKEAAMIIEFNTKSLLSKVSWDEIKNTQWYNELMSDSAIPVTSKAFINDPAKTGIDVKSNIVFFILKPNNAGQAVVEGSLKDSKAFSDFVKSMLPNAPVTKEGELNMLKTDTSVIGWNDERFAFITSSDYRKFQRDSLNDSSFSPIPLAPVSPDTLVSVCKRLFSLNDDNSLYKNEKFAKLIDEEGDIHFWLNTNELSKGSMPGMPGMAGMVKLDKFLEDNISTATINFQNGKITGTHKQYFGKELSDILKKGEGNINTDMIKRLPSQNIAAIFSLHVTPGSILEIIKLTGLDGFINLFLSAEGISLDDIVRATKGDILFAVSDVTVKNDSLKLPGLKDTISDYYNKTDATFLFAVAIGDKDAFNKLLNFSKKMGKDVPQKNSFQKMDDRYFAIGNSQDAVNKYFAGTQINPDFLSKISNHPMGSFVDIQMILKALQTELTKDSVKKRYYDQNIRMWNNFYGIGGEYKNGSLVSETEVNLVDKNTNSLKQLNKYIDALSIIAREEKKKQKEEWTRDSTIRKVIDSAKGREIMQ